MATTSPSKQRVAALRTDLGFSLQRSPHIVDQLIEERAGRLRHHPLLWRSLRQLLYPLLKYHEAIRIADEVADLPGFDVFARVSRELAIRVEVRGIEHVPRDGFFFIVANHPTGIADGIAVFDALSPIRPDLCFMANRDAIRVAAGLKDLIIPVDWRPAFRNTAKTRETVQGLTLAARNRRPVVIFPSGRLAYMTMSGLKERPWLPTTVTLARRYRAPILPLRITSRNSWLYYTLALLSNELRDITVFNELLNKRGDFVGLSFGEPVDPNDLPEDPDRATMALQHRVEIGRV